MPSEPTGESGHPFRADRAPDLRTVKIEPGEVKQLEQVEGEGIWYVEIRGVQPDNDFQFGNRTVEEFISIAFVQNPDGSTAGWLCFSYDDEPRADQASGHQLVGYRLYQYEARPEPRRKRGQLGEWKEIGYLDATGKHSRPRRSVSGQRKHIDLGLFRSAVRNREEEDEPEVSRAG